jgi:acylphosphatase
MEAKICRQCFISGRVQGVSFRYYTRQQAQRLGVGGGAYNLDDGRVEVLACGEAAAVEKLCTWLHQGPPLARVSSVQCQLVSYRECEQDFEIG